MAKIPSKVESRIKDALHRYQPLVQEARARNLGEADTAALVKDILANLFGYDPFSEISAEYRIRGTCSDFALKVGRQPAILVEVKSLNTNLTDRHIRQAAEYGTDQGIEWIILTNAQTWEVYCVCLGQCVSHELSLSLHFSTLNARSDADLEALFVLSKEAQGTSRLREHHEGRLALSPYCVGAAVFSEPVLSALRRELKRVSPHVRIDVDDIERVLSKEVMRRDLLEGDKAAEAKERVMKAASNALRKTESEIFEQIEHEALAAAESAGTGGMPPASHPAPDLHARSNASNIV